MVFGIFWPLTRPARITITPTESQRKILWAAMKHFGKENTEFKVAQLAPLVAGKTMYANSERLRWSGERRRWQTKLIPEDSRLRIAGTSTVRAAWPAALSSSLNRSAANKTSRSCVKTGHLAPAPRTGRTMHRRAIFLPNFARTFGHSFLRLTSPFSVRKWRRASVWSRTFSCPRSRSSATVPTALRKCVVFRRYRVPQECHQNLRITQDWLRHAPSELQPAGHHRRRLALSLPPR